jgi:two-component system sensor histidine kinase YesM
MDASRAPSYDDTVKNAYTRYQNDGDSVALYDSVTAYLNQQYGYDEKFNATFLFFTAEPNTLYYASNRTDSGEIHGLQNYRESAHAGVLALYPDLGTRIGFAVYDGRLYMIRDIVTRTFHPYAVIVMECDESVLFESTSGIGWGRSATGGIDGLTLSVLGEATGDTAETDGVAYDEATGIYAIRQTKRLSGHTLTFTVHSDSAQLTADVPNVADTLPFFGLLSVPLLLFVVWAYTHFVSRPVAALVDAAGRMEAGERGYTVALRPGSREFDYLTQRFNGMSVQLASQFERIYQEQLALQDARVRALRSQINPHFLNNTLEAVAWAARMGDSDKVCRMIEALSVMLDAATARGGHARDTMEKELSYTDAYLYILSERLGERLTVRKEIDPAILKALVPCLILQPIVENAFEHGLSYQRTGELSLHAFPEGDRLIIEVENDGRMTPEDRENIRRLLSASADAADAGQECIGIRNVQRRLQILCGEEGGLSITQTDGGRVLARIVIPHVEYAP